MYNKLSDEKKNYINEYPACEFIIQLSLPSKGKDKPLI
jgi:hypothetical protein